ncbi:type III secretion system chaperone [Verrucomicrobium sp. BvORR034]|jgi:hypothetical protein|uniref:type III secretion system chaperone n=1 Tax=Verrucomicrobium sp. BvORR034 TaxID=1396418 RepID=UPI000678EDBE|nr:type III secretion system chaperone [Verrucomicrobium sp. BvORR034]
MNIPDAIAELGHLLGLGPVGLNEDGAARIIFDDSLEVDFLADENEEGWLHLTGRVCEVGPDVAPAFLKQLLHAHFLGQGTGGATFSLASDDTEIHLGRRLHVTPMEFSEFSNHVETFVNYLEAWRRMVESGEIDRAGAAPSAR